MAEIRKLAIVGASVRAAAFSAVRAGFEAMAADLFADADLRQVCPATRIDDYPHGLADWLRAAQCDAWLYTGALENYPELVDHLAAIRPLLGNAGVGLRAVRDPLRLQQALLETGLSFPETVPLDHEPSAGQWLCKTYRGASGSGVWRLDDPDALARAKREGAVLQRFVDGWPASAVLVCSPGGPTLLGVTRQLLGESWGGHTPWRYAGSIGPAAVSSGVARQLHRLGEVLSRSFELRGLVGVDFIMADDRAVVVEVNPRYSASVEVLEQRRLGHAIAAHVRACQDQPSLGGSPASRPVGHGEPPGKAGETHAKLVLYAKRDVVVSADFFRWAMDHVRGAPQQYSLADVTDAGQAVAAGHPVLTVFAAAPMDAIATQLQRFAAHVESRLYAPG